ncbi:MAG: M23 family metallopeptidase, partial [Firmicutes bacterium]|nr:M23 family metallopeptidase [Bacillota bacterium]
DPGDVVRAAESGVVASAESLPVSGNTVTLEHDNGWRTTYGQLESLLVEPGEEVFKGEIIGYVGQTTKYGVNQGDHLEFSVFVENESVDPKVAVEE